MKLVKKFNTYTVGDLKLRPYQIRIIKNSLQIYKDFKILRIYWVVPMGGGKTFMGISLLYSFYLQQFRKNLINDIRNKVHSISTNNTILSTTTKSITISKTKKQLLKQNKLVREGYKYIEDLTIVTYIASAQEKWVTEILHCFSNSHNIIIIDKQVLSKRIPIWFLHDLPNFSKKKPTIILCRIHTLGNDWEIIQQAINEKFYKITTLLIDEAHVLLNRRIKLRKKILDLTHPKHCQNVICMTGTDQSKDTMDIWSILNILDRDTYSSYWKFYNRWLKVKYTNLNTLVDGIKNGKKDLLHKIIQDDYLFVTNKEAIEFIPSKIRKILMYSLDNKTRKIYNTLVKDKYVTLKNKDILKPKGTLARNTVLNQLTCSPYLLTDTLGYGNALEILYKHAFEQEKYPHIMLGTNFSSAIPIFETFFKSKKSKFLPQNVILIKDSKHPQLDIRKFSKLKNVKTPSILIVSIRKSVGWDLPSCKLAYAITPSFKDLDNRQWEDRMARGEATKVSQIFYLVAKNTINERTIQILNKKNKDTQELTTTTKKVLNKID